MAGRATTKGDPLRPSRLLFANPIGPGRANLRVRLSLDEGRTWPHRKLLTPGEGAYGTQGHTRHFRADATHAEPRGYLSICQAANGVIHLISSKQHYAFNLAWLNEPPPAPSEGLE